MSERCVCYDCALGGKHVCWTNEHEKYSIQLTWSQRLAPACAADTVAGVYYRTLGLGTPRAPAPRQAPSAACTTARKNRGGMGRPPFSSSFFLSRAGGILPVFWDHICPMAARPTLPRAPEQCTCSDHTHTHTHNQLRVLKKTKHTPTHNNH